MSPIVLTMRCSRRRQETDALGAVEHECDLGGIKIETKTNIHQDDAGGTMEIWWRGKEDLGLEAGQEYEVIVVPKGSLKYHIEGTDYGRGEAAGGITGQSQPEGRQAGGGL